MLRNGGIVMHKISEKKEILQIIDQPRWSINKSDKKRDLRY